MIGKVAIASGGFSYFADYLQCRLKLDAAVANGLAIQDAKLTGEVQGDIVDANVKAQTLNRLAEQWSIAPNQTIAMGDGANDLVMNERRCIGRSITCKTYSAATSGYCYSPWWFRHVVVGVRSRSGWHLAN